MPFNSPGISTLQWGAVPVTIHLLQSKDKAVRKYSNVSLTRLVAEKVFIHQKGDLNWTMSHYFSHKLILIGVNSVVGNSYTLNTVLIITSSNNFLTIRTNLYRQYL